MIMVIVIASVVRMNSEGDGNNGHYDCDECFNGDNCDVGDINGNEGNNGNEGDNVMRVIM